MGKSNLYRRYARILKTKRNRISRSKNPLDTTISKSIDIYKLLKLIQKKIKNRALIQEARKQFVITSVTSIEVLFREYFIQLLNFDSIITKFTEQINKKDFNIEDMEFIIENKISKQELIADNYNFQNPSEINKVFSIALSNNFFKNLEEYKWWFDKKNKKNGFFMLGKFYRDLEWLIQLRHDFIHDINYKVKVGKKEVEDIDIFCIAFMSQLGFYMSEKIQQLKNNKN